MHQFRDKSVAQRELVSAGLLFYPVLQAADVLAYRADEVPVGEDQREHLELMRDVARALQRALRRDCWSCPSTGSPTVGARIIDLQDPRTQDVDHRRLRAGDGLRARRARGDREEVQARGHRLRDARSSARRDKPGVSNLIEILAAARGTTPEEVEREFARRAATATSRRRSPRRSSTCWPRCASATTSCAATRPRSSGARRRAPRRRARSRPPTLADVREAMGVGPAALSRRLVRLACARGRSSLELDLDVFSGPFDLLLTLVLREEVDLLEVELADVVLTYLDHLEARGRARPRGRDRVPRPDRGAAGAQVAADAARREEDEELDELEPGEAAEELLARMLESRRYRGAGGAPARAPRRRGTALPLPLRAAARRAAARTRSTHAEQAVRPRAARRGARRAAAHAAARRPAPPRRAARLGGRAPRAPARPAAPRALQLRRGRARRRPRDGRGDAVRAARALQAGRGDLDAGRAVRGDHGRGRATAPGGRGRARDRAAARASRRCCSCRSEPVAGRASSPTRARSSEDGGRARARRAGRARSTAAGSSCASSPAAGRSPPTRSPRTPRGACWPSRARRR